MIERNILDELKLQEVELNLFLKQLSKNDNKQIYEMLQKIEKNDNGFHNEVKDMPYEEYLFWIKKNEEYSKNIGLKDWMVPQTTFWLYKDDMPIGYGRIRHYLNEKLIKDSGHVGYAISSPYRGNGYRILFLKLLNDECIKLDIKRIQI